MKLRRGDGRFFAVLLLLAFTLPALAVVVPTALTGHVISNGKPVARATVTLFSPVLLQPRVTTTTASGAYWIEGLPPGVYEVTFAHAGMTTLTRRAVVELARVSRTDATLEATEEDESVTSTATTVSVADTQPMTAHIADHDLDLMPVWRTAGDAAVTVAGSYSAVAATLLDDGYAFAPHLLGQEALEEVTVVRGAAPPEMDEYGAIVAKTRRGGDDFSFSLRDTLTSTSWIAGIPYYDELARKPRGGGVDHFLEAFAGGPASREHLWFFASAWRGGEDDRALHNVSGYEVKLTSQLGGAHSLAASYANGKYDTRATFVRAGSLGILRYTGIATPQTTLEGVAARSTFTYTPSIFGNGPTTVGVDDSLFAKVSHLTSRGSGDSVLSAGVRAVQSNLGGSSSLFVNDRWSSASVILNVGGRLERGGHQLHVRPRLGATWDVRQNGRHAAFAAFSDYADARSPDYSVQEAVIGYASAIGASGILRADVAHRKFTRLSESGYTSDVLHVESSYRLFERFVAGGFYEYVHQDEDSFPFAAKHAANAWLSAELPLGEHVLAVTLLERYGAYGFSSGARYDTDLALRYTLPVRSVSLTTAVDVTNVFNDRRGDAFTGGRAFRIWFRARH